MRDFFCITLMIFVSAISFAQSNDSSNFSSTVTDIENLLNKTYQLDSKPLKIVIQNNQEGDPQALNDNDASLVILTKTFFENELLSVDGRIMTICHEVGHHLGGAPKRQKTQMEQFFEKDGSRLSWSSAEGQSDYFAAAKCAKLVFSKLNIESDFSPMNVPNKLQKLCSDAYTSESDRIVCERVNMAGLNMLQAYNTKNEAFGFDQENMNPAVGIYTQHPGKQCRLDTILAGSLCNADPSLATDRLDPNIGYCSSADSSTRSKRPACWYNP